MRNICFRQPCSAPTAPYTPQPRRVKAKAAVDFKNQSRQLLYVTSLHRDVRVRVRKPPFYFCCWFVFIQEFLSVGHRRPLCNVYRVDLISSPCWLLPSSHHHLRLLVRQNPALAFRAFENPRRKFYICCWHHRGSTGHFNPGQR